MGRERVLGKQNHWATSALLVLLITPSPCRPVISLDKIPASVFLSTEFQLCFFVYFCSCDFTLRAMGQILRLYLARQHSTNELSPRLYLYKF